jgi:hypothetical protein
VIVHAGSRLRRTRLGTLHVAEELDDAQLEVLVRAIEESGVDWGRVMAARITEAGAEWWTVDANLAGEPWPRWAK